MIKKIITFVLFLSIGINPAAAVENGEIDKGPSRVVSLYVEGLMLGCSGYLYQPRIVLTAAHCVTNQYKITEVGLANKTASPTSERVSVETTIVPEVYSMQSPYHNDFAVLILSKPMPVIGQVSLLTEDIKNKVEKTNIKVKVAGYGEQDTSGTTSKTVRDALYFYATLGSIGDEVQVINNPIGSVCAGDSGGPNTIIYNGQEVYLGATSHGWNQPNCGRASGGGQRSLLFDPVYKFADIIKKAQDSVAPVEPVVVKNKKTTTSKKCVKLKNKKCKK